MAEKTQAPFYTGVRERGQVNTILDSLALQYEKEHPNERTRWEYAPTVGDMSSVAFREAQGLHIVDAKEVGTPTASQQKEGPVRRGDLILMAGPREILDEIDRQDAKAARDDVMLSESTYKEAMASKQYQLASGESKASKGVGQIRRVELDAPMPSPDESGEGGEPV